MPDGATLWPAENNTITDNVFRGNGIDAVMVDQGGQAGLGNCFSGNTLETSRPADIETVLPCDGPEGDLSDMIGIDFFAPPGADQTCRTPMSPRRALPISRPCPMR